jgi:hypothetical protein
MSYSRHQCVLREPASRHFILKNSSTYAECCMIAARVYIIALVINSTREIPWFKVDM